MFSAIAKRNRISAPSIAWIVIHIARAQGVAFARRHHIAIPNRRPPF